MAIDDRTLPETSAVACMPMGSLTKITTGNAAAGVTALVSNKTALTAESVSINNLGGFTGTYLAGLAGNAAVTLQDQTYTIHGWAEGFDTENPGKSATGKFTIQVAC